MALKLPKLDRKTLLDRRYKYMEEAFKIDGGACQSPFHKRVVAYYGKHELGINIKDVHHLMGRTNTGEFDGLEFLITLCRNEHRICETGGCPWWECEVLPGREYEWFILWRLKNAPTNRWNKPRKLLEKQITPERLEVIRRTR